jgi:hypothetical protein
VHGVDRRRRLAVDGEDQIARTQARRGRRPAFRKAGDQDARWDREAHAPSQPSIDRLRLPGESEVTADDPSLNGDQRPRLRRRGLQRASRRRRQLAWIERHVEASEGQFV